MRRPEEGLNLHTESPKGFFQTPKRSTRQGKKKNKSEETEGLISADRGTRTTLQLTIPVSRKVVCNGFASADI